MKITSVVPMKCRRRQVLLRVLAEVIRIELGKAVESLDVFRPAISVVIVLTTSCSAGLESRVINGIGQ
jgi:hypothetical protein